MVEQSNYEHDSEGDGMLDESTTETGEGRSNHSHRSEGSSLVRAENRYVKRSKWLVVLVIALTAIGCGVATYMFTRKGEQDEFKGQYFGLANELVYIIHHEMENVFQSLDSLSTTISVIAQATGVTWPQITVPQFEVMGQKSNALSIIEQVSLAPLITRENKVAWEDYAIEHQGWITEGLQVQASQQQSATLSDDLHDSEENDILEHANIMTSTHADEISPKVWRLKSFTEGVPIPQDVSGIAFGPAHFAPMWQQSPAPHNTSIINYDILSHPVFHRIYHGVWETQLPILSEVMDLKFLYRGSVQDHSLHHSEHLHSLLMQPIYPSSVGGNNTNQNDRDDIKALLLAVISWDNYFEGLMPDGVIIDAVLRNSCGERFTYRIHGHDAEFVGKGELHDPEYNTMMVSADITPFLQHNFSGMFTHCSYELRLFPTSELEDQHTTNNPIFYGIAVVAVFFVTAATFLLYDYLVERRQAKLAATAKRTNAIVASMFPGNVRERIIKDAEEQAERELEEGRSKINKSVFGVAAKKKLRDFLVADHKQDETNSDLATKGKPIADLFPEATIMFADLVGFTAWSSMREPPQVFILLETLFHAFDEIAERRKVFKVETVGDCYVAVAGLPTPRRDHAVLMARFARDCLYKTNDLVKQLETTLGPDTGELSMRVGLHSGPVTAGVLRGQKARFQLFGDTINTTARIEANGMRNKIHLSEETASLLQKAGKGNWVVAREDRIHAKGKGELQTYWLDIKSHSSPSSLNSSRHDDSESKTNEHSHVSLCREKIPLDKKTLRLVDWNTDVLLRLLRLIVAQRGSSSPIDNPSSESLKVTLESASRITLDEVKEIIHMPEFDAEALHKHVDPDSIILDADVVQQMKNFVTTVASMYRSNPFHNFEHASHVTMSVVKLLSRIVAPEAVLVDSDLATDNDVFSRIHDHTYGITSDPLTQFACVFSALIHDVDHSGVPNVQLAKENPQLARFYREQSIAEQNSVDLSWSLLMSEEFEKLRRTICFTNDEFVRFRELVVNSVMATDIVDKQLKELRNARWAKAFDDNAKSKESQKDAIDRKATIVIEHLIQASDIAHTMQHWHIYRKWNERLFHEMYDAYRKGRTEKDPSEFWYEGEIGFFDFYIIPLAKKLKDCGVFGVSSDEYLNYAQNNRREWESKGQGVVAEMVKKYCDQEDALDASIADIQEIEKTTLRSRLLRSDTAHSCFVVDEDDEGNDTISFS